MMKKTLFLILILIVCLACKEDKKSSVSTAEVEATTTNKNIAEIPTNPLKEAYFGETHMHTMFSLDAYIGGNRMTPDAALRFAQGEAVALDKFGKTWQLKRPLDFAAVTDHAENIGEVYTIVTPGAPGYNLEASEAIRNVPNLEEGLKLFVKYVVSNNRSATPQHPDFWQGPASTMNAWEIMNEATEKYNQPGKFTTLHAFEWSGAPNGGNLHRNIIFRDTIVPDLPYSYIDGNRETDLWKWLGEITHNGSTVLAIPHNSNASKGMMFDANMPDGQPITKEYADERNRWERTIEIMQIKGSSEVHPLFWKNDEFANFENANSMADFSGRKFEQKNFVRDALKKGLQYETELGVNPYKLGFNGGTDSHNGFMANVEEDNWTGGHGLADMTAENRVSNTVDGWAKVYDTNPGSITGVWAPSNTRADIWDGMYNRETFATSGPRLKVRLFAGYGYKESYTSYNDMVRDGYEKGVPMGGDLRMNSEEAPKFLVWAIKDPMNANLDRIQIVKGWYENGELKEKIYNVIASDNRLKPDGTVTPTDALVNLETAAFDTSKGAAEFMTTWTDPDFKVTDNAFYYARVLQIPTARWNLYDEIRDQVTYPETVDKTVQERAWSSPIWYTPKK
ncbi:DUF3604 domain-containing protein [Xanthomarina sp. GH4-25]|uniref:DUF3604 domain-containing protein n=1 Tax=Xanthomarina sp. GH4-25 TaxID=3349335 RepID=UPI003877BDF0